MTTTSPNQISLDEFMKYKPLNLDMSPELMEFYNTNKHKFNKGHGRAKFDHPRPTDNWLVSNKFKQNDDEKLYSQFRSILNKLSDSNFDNLAKELTTLEISKVEHLAKLAEFIFNKAIIESKFAMMYARLAKELIGYSIKDDDKLVYFRELLINRCQIMFNDCSSFDPTTSGKTVITKEIATGCMVFIGELYNLTLLTDKIINSCFMLLLMKVGQGKAFIIDCICALMRTCGVIFVQRDYNDAKVVFERIEKLVMVEGKVELSNRDKFALMDVLDARKKQ